MGRAHIQRPARLRITCADPFSDQSTVTVDVLLLQIGQQVTAAADHLEQTTTAVVVVLVGLQVLSQVVDAYGQRRKQTSGEPVSPSWMAAF